MEWQQIESLEGFSEFCFKKGEFVAAAKLDGLYYVWHVFRSGDDKSLKSLNGVWAQASYSFSVPIGLGWAEEQIAETGTT